MPTRLRDMYCTQCGAKVNGKYCTYCGAELPIVSEEGHETSTMNVVKSEAGAVEEPPYYQKKWFGIVIFSVMIFLIIIIAAIAHDVNEPNPNPNQQNISNNEINRAVPAETAAETDKVQAARIEKQTQQSSDNISGMRKDFKEAMDSYESFMNEYVAFMKQYAADPGDWSMLASYLDFLGKYETMCARFEKWEDEDLNDAEMAYYVEVQLRVEKKLLEVVSSMYE